MGAPWRARALNAECLCGDLDRARLARALDGELAPGLGAPGLAAQCAAQPTLFADAPVFLPRQSVAQMHALVATVEAAAALPAWRQAALAELGPAAPDDGPLGVCMGYDFHVDAAGRPSLIEINTNAGGLLLNAALAHSGAPCCGAMDLALPPANPPGAIESAVLAMFAAEWARARAAGWPVAQRDAPRLLAIVDEHPDKQFLWPEFQLYARLLRQAGWPTLICPPHALHWRHGQLWHGDGADAQPVDMVYNRLTDFSLSDPACAPLRQAWQARQLALTPHPLSHALLADKRRLLWLSAPDWLAQAGVDAKSRQLLQACAPQALEVSAEHAAALWAERRRWFFKPAAGYGSRAAYRGDKLTRRVWEDILRAADGPPAGRYIAQALRPPGERAHGDGPHKLDVRVYAYAGAPLALAARLYRGQTTNFRTPGGGFARVRLSAD